jgi:hypothetical protein
MPRRGADFNALTYIAVHPACFRDGAQQIGRSMQWESRRKDTAILRAR